MNKDSFKQTVDMFSHESAGLIDSIRQISKRLEPLEVHEIIQIYYQAINVSSIIKVLKPQLDEQEHKELSEMIRNSEVMINKNFNGKIHPAITRQLSDKIKDSMTDLKEIKKDNQEKTRERIENEAKLFEKLREIMSTKEFVDQYNRELGHD